MRVEAPVIHIRGILTVFGIMTVESAAKLTVTGTFELACRDQRGRDCLRGGELIFKNQSHFVNYGQMRLDARSCPQEQYGCIMVSSQSNVTLENKGLLQVEGYGLPSKYEWKWQVELWGILLVNFRSLQISSTKMRLERSGILQRKGTAHVDAGTGGMGEGPMTHIKRSKLFFGLPAEPGLACIVNDHGQVVMTGDVCIERYFVVSACALLVHACRDVHQA